MSRACWRGIANGLLVVVAISLLGLLILKLVEVLAIFAATTVILFIFAAADGWFD